MVSPDRRGRVLHGRSVDGVPARVSVADPRVRAPLRRGRPGRGMRAFVDHARRCARRLAPASPRRPGRARRDARPRSLDHVPHGILFSRGVHGIIVSPAHRRGVRRSEAPALGSRGRRGAPRDAHPLHRLRPCAGTRRRSLVAGGRARGRTRTVPTRPGKYCCRNQGFERCRASRRARCSAPCCPLLALPIVLWVLDRAVGDPWAFSRAQRFWERRIEPPWVGLIDGIRVLWPGNPPYLEPLEGGFPRLPDYPGGFLEAHAYNLLAALGGSSSRAQR